MQIDHVAQTRPIVSEKESLSYSVYPSYFITAIKYISKITSAQKQ